MTYTTGIPQDGQTLGSSKPQVRTNFNLISSVFDVNHVDFNSSGAGKHNFVSMPQQGSDPATAASEIALYSKVGSTSGTNTFPCLFYRGQSNATPYQMSNVAPSLGSNGYTWLPGGLLLQWGSFNTNATGGTVNYPIAFTTVYNVFFSYTNTNQFVVVTSISSPSAFTWVSKGAVNATAYWLALGLK